MRTFHPPVEEETERTMDDPYVNALEGITSSELAPCETVPPVAALPEHLGISTSSTIMTGAGGSAADILLPEVTEVLGTGTESVVNPSETVSKEAKEAASSEPANPTVEPPSGKAETEKSSATPKAKAKSVSMRKPPAPKETQEQQAERAKAEKMADELVRQEEEEKKKQAAKDAKSKKAAAAAAQQRKAKEQPAEGEQTNAQKRRIKAATPDNDPGDKPPPEDDDDQPWEIYHYRPHIEVSATLLYESEDRAIRRYDLESSYNLDVRGTRKPLVHACQHQEHLVEPERECFHPPSG